MADRNTRHEARLRLTPSIAAQSLKRAHQAGFTLVELLVTMAVLAITITFVMPSISGFTDRENLVAVAEQVYADLHHGRSVTVSRSAPVFINFSAGGTAGWRYGVSVNTGCNVGQADPTQAGACVLVVNDGDANIDPGDGSVDTGDLVLHRTLGSDYGNVTMTLANFTTGTQVIYDPVRGTSSAGEVRLASPDGRQLFVKQSLLGYPRICSPDGSVGGFTTSNC